MKIEDVDVLPGWHSFPVAAGRLGVQRQRINQLLEENKLGKDEVSRVPGSGDRPAILLISEPAVQRLLGEKARADEARVSRQVPAEVPAA